MASARRQRWVVMATAFGLALMLYARTLVPDIFVSDFVEFQYQPLRLGLPHPNGFPFYMLLGWLASHLPVGTVAWRMNLLSAVIGALAVAITAGFVHRLTGRVSMAMLAGGLLALTPTFWYYSLAAERYTLQIALLAATVWSAWEAGQRQSLRWAWGSAFLLGLGLATHPSDALFLPFWLAYLIVTLPKWRFSWRLWLGLTAAGALPGLLYIYVPLRWAAFSQWPLLPGIDRSSAIYQGLTHVWYEPGMRWDLIWNYIVGLGGYATGLAGGGWGEARANLWIAISYWQAEIPWTLLALALVGAIYLWRRDRALVLALVSFSLVLVVMVAYIHQGKWEAYLLPAFWVVLFLDALGVTLLVEALARLTLRAPRLRLLGRERLWTPLVLLTLVIVAGQRYPQRDLSRWSDSRDWWELTLAQPIAAEAGLLAHWSDLTPLWYLQQVENRRTDLVGLFPPDIPQVIEPWLDAGKELYLAGPLHEWALELPFRFTLVPWGSLVRILKPGQHVTCPPQARTLETPASWPFMVTSWDIDPVLSNLSQPLEGGKTAALRLCWRARTELPRDTFLTLELRPEDSASPFANNEPLVTPWYPQPSLPAGTEGLAVLPVHLPLGAAPGDYAASLAPYRLIGDRVEPWPDVGPVSLGTLTVTPGSQFSRAALTDETAPLIPLRAGPLVLRAWRVSEPAVRPGDPVQIDLLWEVREPVKAPLSVVLSFRDRRNPLSATVTPALALPKAVASSQPGALVRSVHIVAAPRGRGDHSYWVEPRLQMGEKLLSWLPTGRLVIGAIDVKDRPHLDSVPQDVTAVEAKVGDLATLAGYHVETIPAAPGADLPVTLYWQVRTETDTSYLAFIHVVDDKNQIVAQHDGIPGSGKLPTTLWTPGEVISDTHRIALPPDLPPGEYRLKAGLFTMADGAFFNLPTDPPAPDNRVDLGPIALP